MSKLLLLVLTFTAITRLYNIGYPHTYVFDEVYHAFTAKEYSEGNKDAWNPFAKPPEGVAYEWLHPPISKEIMTLSMKIFDSSDPWAWRLPGALLGIISVYLVFLISKQLFKNELAAFLSAFIFSIEGLNFVQSRIGMNDIYLVTFVLASLLFFLKSKFLLSAILVGLAVSTKWPGVFLLPIYLILLFYQKQFKYSFYFLLIPAVIYLISYVPYFLLGYNIEDFINLHKQIWWYQTNLKATHDYASPWWSWPLNLYPVWYFVEYQGNKISNIFASGNFLVFLLGSVAIIFTLWEFIKKRSATFLIILLGFFVFWLPWSISPRIMFLYHFSPSVPFLSLALGYQLSKMFSNKNSKLLTMMILGLMFLNFILIFPFLTGIPIPKEWVHFFFYTNITKNPFL